MAKIDLGLIRGSLWYQGTKITGQSTEGIVFPETGISEAMSGDKYQNSETNDLYDCIKGGPADTAQWAWYGNISFGDISDRAVNYELPETVDMSQVPASGGLLKNFIGWIFKSISSLNSAITVIDITNDFIASWSDSVKNVLYYSSVKYGKVVCASVIVNVVKSSEQRLKLCDIIEGFKPLMIYNYVTCYDNSSYQTNGVINIRGDEKAIFWYSDFIGTKTLLFMGSYIME